jgi:hypothetical protein
MLSFWVRRRKRFVVCAAILFLLMIGNFGCTPAPTKPYDVVITDLNSNLTPLNPQWFAQSHDHQLPSPDLCGGAKPWEPACASQSTWANESSGSGIGCNEGHRNWMWTTYDGSAFWDEHATFDDDYNINLVRPDQAGSTITNNGVLPMEFDSDITIDHFDVPNDGWWHKFHNAVDESDFDAGVMLYAKQVLVLGLLGLDTAHSSHSELHPVVAMAVHIKNDPHDDRWAVFAMNWGDEGWCSSNYELFPEVLPVSFLLPRPGAIGVKITSADFRCKCEPGSKMGLDLKTDRGAELWFKLPKARATTGWISTADGERVHGEIHLQWSVRPGEPPEPPKQVAVAQPPSQREAASDVEVVGNELIAKMTPEQRATFDRLAPAHDQSRDEAMLTTRMSALAPEMPSNPPQLDQASQLVTPDRSKEQRLRVEALRAAYGGSLPEPFR